MLSPNEAIQSQDAETMSLMTDYIDVGASSDAQFKVYVDSVPGGAKAVITGKDVDKRQDYKSKIEHFGMKGSPARASWDKMHQFALDIGGEKYLFKKK